MWKRLRIYVKAYIITNICSHLTARDVLTYAELVRRLAAGAPVAGFLTDAAAVGGHVP